MVPGIHRLILIAAFFGMLVFPMSAAETKSRVLILSGANNHDWKSTTPAIRAALEESGRFTVDVEENVFAMTAESFTPYAVILSNFNTYGKNPPKGGWSAETKKAFLDHIGKGRGLVIVHAGSSVFYDWPEFQNLACGTWKDGTNHGAIHAERVTFSGEESPITQGLEPFWIRDEFWQKTAVVPGAKALASVTPDPAFKGSGKQENNIFSTEFGGGRGFAIFLGHDVVAMSNPAWRTLLQRGTEWAATGKVTIPPAKNWPTTKEDALQQTDYSWVHHETSLGLCKNGKTVWQLVADPKQPKVYFHPLSTVDGEVLTVTEPADHPWHHGLWSSWKFINGVNYWEENPKTHVSDGTTELTGVVFKPAENFGAKIEVSLSYHLPGEASLMTERRLLSITPPDAEGAYRIDWESEFTVGNAPVNLGRTPLPNEEGGKDYGGYAGLSARLLLKPDGWSILTSEGPGKAPEFHGKTARWMDFSSTGAGIAICDHPSNLRSPSPWYVHDQKPMSYFSPAVLYREPLVLAAGQSLKLKYRVLVHSKAMTAAQLDADFKNFTGETKP
jgi:type 1 glutamine amidotransferase